MTAPARSERRERHRRRFTHPTVPCRAHRGRTTPAGTAHRRPAARRSHIHLPRPSPVEAQGGQHVRACSCGLLRMGRDELELAAWFEAHRRGLPEPPKERHGRTAESLRRLDVYRRTRLRPHLSALAARLVALRPRPAVRGLAQLGREVLLAATLAADALRSWRDADELTTVWNARIAGNEERPHLNGLRCLDPHHASGLRRAAKRVELTNRNGEHVEIIRSRHGGRPGWRDVKSGRWFGEVRGAAAVDIYGRGAGGVWTSAGTWSLVSSAGGSSGTTPANTDRALLDSGSGNITLGAASLALSLDCTGVGAGGTGSVFVGIVSGTGASALTLGSNNTPVGSVILRFRGSFSSTGALTVGTGTMPSGTFTCGQTGGFAPGAGMAFAATSSGTIIQLNNDVTTTTTFNKSGAGQLDINGKTVIVGTSMAWSAGTVTCGAATIQAATTVSITLATLTCNSATITAQGSSMTVTPTTLAAGTSEFKMTSAGTVTFTPGASSSFYKVTRTSTAAKTDELVIAADFTVTNTLTLNGGSALGVNRNFVYSSVNGTQRTIACAGATVVIGSDQDFKDTNISGSPTWTNASPSYVGDCVGNAGAVTTNANGSVAQTYSGGAANTSDVTKWTSRVPLPQDDVTFGAGQSGTATNDMPRLGRNFDSTNSNKNVNLQTTPEIYGNFTVGASSTVATFGITFAGRGAQTITVATGGSITGPASAKSVTIDAIGGSYTLQDDNFVITQGSAVCTFTVTSGTFATNNHAMTANLFIVNGGTFNAGTSTITSNIRSNTATVWTYTSGTLSMASSTFVYAGAASTTTSHTFAGGGQTYGSLSFNVADSPGVFAITGSNTWAGTWTVGPGHVLQIANGTTQTFTGGGNPLAGVGGARSGYVRVAGGATGNYISAPDLAAYTGAGIMRGAVRVALDDWTPAATNVLMAHSTTVGNQRGWQFFVATSGALTFQASSTGAAFGVDQASSAPSLVDGTAFWVGYEYDTSTGALTFYKAADQASEPAYWSGWTQISTHSVTGIVPFNCTASMTVGENGSSGSTGNFYRAVFYTSSTTKQFDTGSGLTQGVGGTSPGWLTSTATTFTEASSNAATVTLNGTAPNGDGRLVLQSSTPGSAATLSVASGPVLVYFLSIKDSTATGGASFFALSSTNVSGNTGWTFNSYTPTQTDSEGLLDSRASSLSRTLAAEAEGLLDSASTALGAARSQTDPEGLLDSSSRAVVGARSQTDSESLTDSSSSVQVAQRSATDLEGLTDSSSQASVASRSPADSEGLTDAAVSSLTAGRTATDPEGLLDAATAAQAVQRSQSDSEGLLDSTSQEAALERSQSDSEGLSDSSSPALTIARALTDPEGLLDAISFARPLLATISDNLGLTDSESQQVLYAVMLSDLEGLLDGALQEAELTRVLTDNEGLADFVLAASLLGRLLADPLGLTDETLHALLAIVAFTGSIAAAARRGAIGGAARRGTVAGAARRGTLGAHTTTTKATDD